MKLLCKIFNHKYKLRIIRHEFILSKKEIKSVTVQMRCTRCKHIDRESYESHPWNREMFLAMCEELHLHNPGANATIEGIL